MTKTHDELSRLFVEATADGLVAVSLADGRIRFVNPSFASMTGYAREELEGEPVALLTALPNSHASSRDRRIDADIFQVPGFYNEIGLGSRTGEPRYVSVKVRHARLGREDIAFAVVSDDTERLLLVRDLTTKHQTLEGAYVDLERVHSELKSTQDKMIRASKLVALGELAAGMSHELNQPLTGIRGFAQELRELVGQGSAPVAKLCDAILTNADRAAGLLSHLRNFARSEREGAIETPAEPVPLRTTASNVETLLGRQLAKSGVQLEFRGFDEPLVAWGRAYPVEQILINLITNARDAVLDRVRTAPQPAGRVCVKLEAHGDDIVIRVSDNGGGVSEKAKSRIFDPFYSTKEPGSGMGLGLSISYGLAHRMNGELTLESTGATGSTFVLTLPQASTQRRAA